MGWSRGREQPPGANTDHRRGLCRKLYTNPIRRIPSSTTPTLPRAGRMGNHAAYLRTNINHESYFILRTLTSTVPSTLWLGHRTRVKKCGRWYLYFTLFIKNPINGTHPFSYIIVHEYRSRRPKISCP